ncbi:DUF7344 domain-containing protein [Halorussus salinisoli]|uniref:DUF7344 domain-containing protein n=1 Tax=Halorussus salinisoli TaxID=2558242 RepID=UPI0010C177BC|nr:hypothetical protein [Halorussus salinisoli]
MVGTPTEFDTVLDVCEHKHRRIVLAALVDQQQSVPINDLTKAIVKRTAGQTVTEIQTALHHAHLPKLEAAGLVEYDSERQLAESTAQLNRGVPHLSAILSIDPELATPLNV